MQVLSEVAHTRRSIAPLPLQVAAEGHCEPSERQERMVARKPQDALDVVFSSGPIAPQIVDADTPHKTKARCDRILALVDSVGVVRRLGGLVGKSLEPQCASNQHFGVSMETVEIH